MGVSYGDADVAFMTVTASVMSGNVTVVACSSSEVVMSSVMVWSAEDVEMAMIALLVIAKVSWSRLLRCSVER